MEHDAEARRGFARMGFGSVLLFAVGGVCTAAAAAAFARLSRSQVF
jgi:hypothetical protein